MLLLSSIFHFLCRYYGRPISLNITQVNASTGTDFTHYQYNETLQQNRTINLIISIRRKNTLNSLLSWYLKRYKIFILVKCDSDGIELQAKDEPLKENEIIPLEDGTGFYIDISNYLKSIALHDHDATPQKTVPYFIKETRTPNCLRFANANETTHVNPELVVDGYKKAPFLLRRIALNWMPDQHEIRYYYNGR